MDKEEQRYFDDKFGQVHKRITDSQEAQTAELHRVTIEQNKEIAEIKESISTHKVESATHDGNAIAAAAAAARKAVDDHREDSWIHNPLKTWAMLGGIAGVVGAVGALVMWIAKHFHV